MARVVIREAGKDVKVDAVDRQDSQFDFPFVK
jgi:hypothetical protein